jgi:hypothetical protein
MAARNRCCHTTGMAIASMLGELLIELFCYVAIAVWAGTLWFGVVVDFLMQALSPCTAAPPSS